VSPGPCLLPIAYCLLGNRQDIVPLFRHDIVPLIVRGGMLWLVSSSLRWSVEWRRFG
jgi:hypothetical protein